MNTKLWRPVSDWGWMLVCTCALSLGCGEARAPVVTTSLPAGPAAADESSSEAEGGARGVARAAASPAGHPEPEKPKFDPIEINGQFFAGWEKPKLALVMSGRQDGYLEPCGCAGRDQQKGGISRRDSLIKELVARGWPVVAVDVGGMVRRFGRQAEIQFAISAEALKKMGYSAVGFGPDDLRLSAGDVVAAVAGTDPDDSTIFVSANVSLFDLTPKTRIIEAGGMKLGVTSVLGQEYQERINNDEVSMQPAAEALKKVVGELAECDARILLAHATLAESKALARQFPEFDFVVTADGPDIPPAEPEKIEDTKTRLIEIAPKAMYVIVAGFYDDRERPVRFQRVALDSRYPDSPDMKSLMAKYQDQLQQLGWEGVGIKSVPHPRAQQGGELAGKFAGAASCQECHPTTFGIWSKTPHARATETLTRLDPPRQYDAECISCHSTGWNPQDYFPYTSGFDSLETTPLLAGNQCENCHGPAAAHIAAEKGRNRVRKEAEREALKLTAAFALENVCIKCHDHDNSPEFNAKTFESHYWPKVEHKGKR
ncbi:MAG: multiheme c-type cytochrome [Pirellulales bacterium]